MAKLNALRELRSAMKEELSAEDIVHYGKMGTALKETILLLGEVDQVIQSAGGWLMGRKQ